MFFIGTNDGINMHLIYGEWLDDKKDTPGMTLDLSLINVKDANGNEKFGLKDQRATFIKGSGKVQFKNSEEYWEEITINKDTFNVDKIDYANTFRKNHDVNGIYIDSRYYEYGTLKGFRFVTTDEGKNSAMPNHKMVNIVYSDDGTHFGLL